MVYVTQVTTAQVDETQVAMDLAEETTLPPQRSDDGDTPAPQGAPTPPARWRERETGLLGQLQRYHQQHGGRYQRGRNGTQHQERQPQLPARRGIQERPPESHLRMSGQAGGR